MLTQYFSAPEFSYAMLALVLVEGLAAFLSPCILPMLPVYLLYLGGGDTKGRRALLYNTGGFVLGFTLLFMAMGAGATVLGKLLQTHLPLLMRLGGALLIVMGLQAMGVLHAIGWRRKGGTQRSGPKDALTPLRAVAFGAAFALTWTPCVGPLLGAALTMAGQSANLLHGLALLLCFSLGLGIPFVLMAILYHKLTGTLNWLKRHLILIQRVSGALLIVFGILMLTGVFGVWSGLFAG